MVFLFYVTQYNSKIFIIWNVVGRLEALRQALDLSREHPSLRSQKDALYEALATWTGPQPRIVSMYVMDSAIIRKVVSNATDGSAK